MRIVRLLTASLLGIVLFASGGVQPVLAESIQSPAELSAVNTRDRHSYDIALTQLADLMHKHTHLVDFEDAVDSFQIYNSAISRQEIGETLYIRYSWVGPAPAKKYFGDRAVAAAKAAQLAAEAAAAKAKADQAAAAEAQAKAKVKPTTISKTYVNSAGNTVQSPVTSSSVPAGATARCKDGTYSFSQTHSGTCSHHGGAASWL